MSTSGRGIYGLASSTTGTNYGIMGRTYSADGYAGYFDGNVHLDGDVEITGSYNGFPRPAYDSGWMNIPAGSVSTVNHNPGGDVDSYHVEPMFNCHGSEIGIHTRTFGGDSHYTAEEGAYWSKLTPNSIQVHRLDEDIWVNEFRVLIWVWE